MDDKSIKLQAVRLLVDPETRIFLGDFSASKLLKKHGANQIEALARYGADRGLDAESSREFARQAFTELTGRRKAIEKFGPKIGSRIVFDSDGLQMASGIACSSHHADLLIYEGCSEVYDLTAGIGGDSMAFALAGINVIAFENDPLRVEILNANVSLLGLSDKTSVISSNWMNHTVPCDSALYLDPPRRDADSKWGGAEIAFKMISAALATKPRLLVTKLSPAFDESTIPAPSIIEYVSEDGVCKEALAIYTNRSESSIFTTRSAVIVPTKITLDVKDNDFTPQYRMPVQGEYVFEPDPALIRARGIKTLCRDLGLDLIAPKSDYLTSKNEVANPFLKTYLVTQVLPYDLRVIQTLLNDLGCISLVVKTRGTEFEPERIRAQFILAKSGPHKETVMALVSQGKKTTALFLEPLAKTA